MAENELHSPNFGDNNLIDLENVSPDLNQSILVLNPLELLSESLLDSEPLRFERTLLKCHTDKDNRKNSIDSIELDQVLITIEDEQNETNETQDLDNNLENNNCSLDSNEQFDDNLKNYDETLLVLDELDRILNIHDDFSETEQQNLNEEEQNVDDCLRELDDYLQTFDSGDEDCLCPTDLIAEQKGVLKDSELRQRLNRLVARSASLGRNGKLKENHKYSEFGTLARNHRFRATISALRRELKPNETVDSNANPEKTLIKNKNLSSSSKDVRQQINDLVRNSNLRATICALHNTNFLPNKRIYQNLQELKYSESQIDNSGCTAESIEHDRISVNVSHVDSFPHESTQEVHPSMSQTEAIPEMFNENKTEEGIIRVDDGNVLPDLISSIRDVSVDETAKEEIQQSTSRMFNSLRVIDNVEIPKPDVQRPSSSSWLRSSMRRIRHFRLPSDPSVSEMVVTVIPPEEVPVISTPVVIQQRPFSAPVRLGAEVSGGQAEVRVREEVTRGHARTGSESSRSRRARSLSSSDSSLASSVDSAPSCAQTANQNGTAGVDIPPATTRR